MASQTPPVASRYNGLGVGPRLSYGYETQVGVPVDGTNATVRTYSPFTIALVPPSPGTTSSTGNPNNLSFSAAAASTGSTNASGVATGLLSDYRGTSYVSNLQAVAAASAPRPAGLNLPPTSIIADAYTAADIRVQRDFLARMADEPLTLLVNPSEMTVTRERIHSYQARTRYGYVYQVWGEQQVKLSFSGSTAGFVAGSSRGYQAIVEHDTGSPSGYQWGSRKDSAAWQNFAALVQFYRNNGYVYDTLGGSEAHLMIGAIRITYDDIVYEGHIESLNYSFDENSPHRVQFDMEFTADFITDQSRASGAVAPMAQPTGGAASQFANTVAPVLATAGGAVARAAGGAATFVREVCSTPMGDFPVESPSTSRLA
ncbi:MAG: hypothetical protein EBT79_07690 [Actinobacteria bacterium]|nr:hypothetical protein [Actinomycetota bacterium]